MLLTGTLEVRLRMPKVEEVILRQVAETTIKQASSPASGVSVKLQGLLPHPEERMRSKICEPKKDWDLLRVVRTRGKIPKGTLFWGLGFRLPPPPRFSKPSKRASAPHPNHGA